ncbi:MAG TPA: LamG-like jellyroll fold domain-containing protein [Kofleriaceae bacterium]|jgi:hypothetical protein
MRTLLSLIVLSAGACGSDSGGARHPDDAPHSGCEALDVDVVGSAGTTTTVNAMPNTGFTWELWFNATTVPTNATTSIQQGATMFASADFHQCEDSYLGFGSEQSPSNELTFNLDGAGGCGARDLTPLHYLPPAGFEANHWYFAAATHDYATGESNLYLDGAVVATKVSAAPAVDYTAPITVGRWSDRSGVNNYNQFHGALDELLVVDHAVAASDVMADFVAGTRTADVIAGYHFDGDAKDFVGGGDLTLEGAPTFGAGHQACP